MSAPSIKTLLRPDRGFTVRFIRAMPGEQSTPLLTSDSPSSPMARIMGLRKYELKAHDAIPFCRHRYIEAVYFHYRGSVEIYIEDLDGEMKQYVLGYTNPCICVPAQCWHAVLCVTDAICYGMLSLHQPDLDWEPGAEQLAPIG